MVMKGDWLLVLALRDRANKESVETPVVEKEEEEQYGDLAIWLQHRFNGYFTVLVKIHLFSTFKAACMFFLNRLAILRKKYSFAIRLFQ